jgi:hypothetical protein
MAMTAARRWADRGGIGVNAVHLVGDIAGDIEGRAKPSGPPTISGMRGPLLRNMRVMAGLSAAEVAREARLSSHAVRQAEGSEEVAPATALQYLLAIERFLQERCSIAGTVRGLVYEASDLIDEADGRRVPPRRFPRLSDMVSLGDGSRRSQGQEVVGRVTSSEEAVALARRAVRRERFLSLWRHRLETRYEPGRPGSYRDAPGMRVLEVKKAELQLGIFAGWPPDSRGSGETWCVEVVEDPPRPGFTGYYHAHTWEVRIDAEMGRVLSVISCR